MTEKKITTISDPWASWKAYDDSELCPESSTIDEYIGDDVSLYEQLQQLNSDKYTSNNTSSGRSTSYSQGVVISVLSGKHANNDASTLGRETGALNVRGTRPVHEEVSVLEGKAPALRVKVKLFCEHQHLPWPEDDKDIKTIDQYPEAVAFDASIDEKAVVAPGSAIWVALYNSDDVHSGIIGVIVNALDANKPSVSTVDISPKNGFKPKCTSPLNISDGGQNYVADTVSILDNGPLVRRVKKKIPLGVFGNGTAQTKSHFVASLLNSDPSTVQNLEGPADSFKNAFIWVGHLKNNGYLDHVDRPSTIGRETIIYAPKYFTTAHPYEIIYYLHDRSGFGFCWVDGPKTTVEQAIANASLEGNDFSQIIGPAIKNLSLLGRNFILVIPEMMHSRGYGTSIADASRIQKYTLGQDVGKGSVVQFDLVQRVNPEVSGNEAALASLRANLQQKSYNQGGKTLASINRFVERQYSTFDNSYTGGNFFNFDAEVQSTIQAYLGNDLGTPNITIVADGLSSVTLAAMSIAPENGLPGLSSVANLKRINYITAEEDFGLYSPTFSSFPSIALFENLVSGMSDMEFNYVTKYSATLKNNLFFSHVNLDSYFRTMFKPGSNGRIFSKPASVGGGAGGTGICLHLSSNKSLYGLVIHNESTINTELLRMQKPSLSKVLQSEIPNHAAQLSTKPSVAAMLEAESKINSLNGKNEFFNGFLFDFVNSSSGGLTASSQVCLNPDWKIFCRAEDPTTPDEAKFVNMEEGSRLQTMYSDWYENYKEIVKQEMIQEALVEVAHINRNLNLLDQSFVDVGKMIEDFKKSQKNYDALADYYSTFRFSDWDPSVDATNTNAESILRSDIRNFHMVEVLELKRKKLQQIYDQYTSAQISSFSDPDCATPATSLGLLKNNNISGSQTSNAFIECGRLRLSNPAPSSYAELSNYIPFYPTKQDFVDLKKNDIQQVEGYKLLGFKYLTRKANSKISYLNSAQTGTKVWQCIVPIIEESWENACVISKYIPFRAAFGFRADPTPNLKDSLSLHNLGLAIDVDPALSPSGNDKTSGVFTNSWKLGIGGNYEIDQLGIFSERFFDLKNNVYKSSIFTGETLITTDDWDSAYGAHRDKSIGDYLTGMHKGNVVCPLESNPLLWVLVFCETSGMKWCNSTFMRKRYRGGQRWSPLELKKIDRIFGINNVVRRVEAISHRSTKGEALNNHMQFQWWSSRSTIKFDEIRQAEEINGVQGKP